VGLGRPGIQLQGAQRMFSGGLPVLVVQQLDLSYGSVGSRIIAIKRECLDGILLGQYAKLRSPRWAQARLG
jgi:hypothetical protein